MPILDVQLVQVEGESPRAGLAGEIAEAAAEVLRAPKGRLWVRLSVLPIHRYAENGVRPVELPHPVFVTVLHAVLPGQAALAAEAQALAAVLASVIGCAKESVHIEYEPQGRGRVAFGGQLVQ
jgi:phenylpyruvate tautomerase PptA (4-oxalocrotonate tautomerase family)